MGGFSVRILAKVIEFGRATVTIEVFNTTTGRFDNKYVKPLRSPRLRPTSLRSAKSLGSQLDAIIFNHYDSK